jgi:arsenite methyltransferase
MNGKQQPHYGFDAPDIMRNFLIVGAIGVMAGLLSITLFSHTALHIAGFIVLAFCSIALILGLSMYGYGVHGKFVMRDFMLNKIHWKGDETVLDVGTGRGLFLVGAAQKLTTGKSIGIDIWNQEDLSGNNAANAYKNAEIAGVLDKVTILNEDAQKMSFANHTFEVVFSMFCIHNIPTKEGQEKACFEIARVLKPNGRALIGDYIPTHSYAKYFEKAGLQVISSKHYIGKVKALMWMVEAVKA